MSDWCEHDGRALGKRWALPAWTGPASPQSPVPVDDAPRVVTWRVLVDCFVDNGTPFGASHHQVRFVTTAAEGCPELAELLGEHAGHVLADVHISRQP